MDIRNAIQERTKVTAGEVLVLTEGEYDSHRVEGVVRICRDADLRGWADAYLRRLASEFGYPLRQFSTHDFVAILEAEGVLEVLPARELQMAGDVECMIATPEVDRGPVEWPEPLPYEELEAVFDPRVPG